MGNRATLYLKSKQHKDSQLIFEANNHLPFFWILLLDVTIIKKNKNKFIESHLSNNKIYESTFKINIENLENNTVIALDYLRKNYPLITGKFESFSNYLKEIILDNDIVLDFLEIANFSTATDLINNIENIIKDVEKSVLLTNSDFSEYLYKETYVYLTGDDNLERNASFSDFNLEYYEEKRTLKIEEQKRKNKKMNYIFFIGSFIFLLLFIYVYMNYEFKVFIWWGIPFLWWSFSKDIITGKGWLPKKKVSKSIRVFNNENQKKLEEIIEELPDLNTTEKKGYTELTKLCCSIETQKILLPFLENLKDFSNEEEYLSTLNYVIDYLNENDLFFIMSLDWKQDIETLEFEIKNALKNNFGLETNLPNIDDYEKKSVSFDNVFEDFDKPLREIKFQMGFIDTQSDEYVIVIHKIEDKEKVIKAIHQIGYEYLEK